VQPPIDPTARPHRPCGVRVPSGRNRGATLRRAHPAVSRNRGRPLGDHRARRAGAVRSPGGPLLLAEIPRWHKAPAPGREHTPGKITRWHQQVRLAIHWGVRPAHRTPHRVSPSSRRATPTSRTRTCSSLSPGACRASATTSANTDRYVPSRAVVRSSSMSFRPASFTVHLGTAAVGAQGAVRPSVVMPRTLGGQRVEVDPLRRTGSPVPDTPRKGVFGTVLDGSRG